MAKKYLFTLLAILTFHTAAASAGLPIVTGYTYTTGSDDYTSHSLSGETTVSSKTGNNSLTGTLTLFSDIEYAAIGSIALKVKKEIGNALNAGLMLGLSRGNLKSNNSPVSSTSWGVLFDKSVYEIFTLSMEYMNTRGSIYSEIYKDALIQSSATNGNGKGKGKGDTTTTTTIVQTVETIGAEYSSDTISAIIDADLDGIIPRVSSSAQLSLSQSSNDIKFTSYGLSLIYHLSAETSVSTTYTLTNDNFDQTKNYLGLGITKTF